MVRPALLVLRDRSDAEPGEEVATEVGQGDDEDVAGENPDENPEEAAEEAAPGRGEGDADSQGEEQGDDEKTILHETLRQVRGK